MTDEKKKPILYRSGIKYSNEIELIDTVLSIYTIAKFEENLRLKNYERNILVYYVRNGINKESLESVCEDRKINKNYLHKINKDLRDKGYLISSETNYRKFHLNPELENIRMAFIDNKLRMYLLTFDRIP